VLLSDVVKYSALETEIQAHFYETRDCKLKKNCLNPVVNKVDLLLFIKTELFAQHY